MKSQKCVEYSSVQNSYSAKSVITLMICAVFFLLPQSRVWADEEQELLLSQFSCGKINLSSTDKTMIINDEMTNGVKLRLQNLKNIIGGRNLKKFAICAENSSGELYGCNVDTRMELMSLTKLVYADMIYNKPNALNYELNAGVCKTNESETKLFGGDHPNETLENLKKFAIQNKLGSNFCSDDDLEFRPLSCIDPMDGKAYYDKLSNDPTNGSFKKKINECIKFQKPKKCNGACVSDSISRYKIKDVLRNILVRSDSYAILKLAKYIEPNLGKNSYGAKYSVDGGNGYSESCKDLLSLSVLEKCDPEKLPNEGDTNSTWHTHYGELETKALACGKTGSSALQNIVNFAGCTRKNAKSPVTRVAMLFDFDGKSLGTQDELDELRQPVYDAFFPLLVDEAHSASEIAGLLAGGVPSNKVTGSPSPASNVAAAQAESASANSRCQLCALTNDIDPKSIKPFPNRFNKKNRYIFIGKSTSGLFTYSIPLLDGENCMDMIKIYDCKNLVF